MKHPLIDFLDSTHTYLVNGHEMPSVTQILKDAGIIPRYYTKASASQGKRKHKIIEAYLKNNLDFSKLSQDELLFIEIFQSFLDNEVLKILAIEEINYNKLHGYAGTLDLRYLNKNNQKCITDLKTGRKEKWHDLQLAAYYNLCPCVEAGKLYISPNGYELIPVDYEKNFKIFLSALNLYKWKHANE